MGIATQLFIVSFHITLACTSTLRYAWLRRLSFYSVMALGTYRSLPIFVSKEDKFNIGIAFVMGLLASTFAYLLQRLSKRKRPLDRISGEIKFLSVYRVRLFRQTCPGVRLARMQDVDPVLFGDPSVAAYVFII